MTDKILLSDFRLALNHSPGLHHAAPAQADSVADDGMGADLHISR